MGGFFLDGLVYNSFEVEEGLGGVKRCTGVEFFWHRMVLGT